MPKLSIPELALKKVSGEKLTMVAVGEAMSASWAEKAGIDIISPIEFLLERLIPSTILLALKIELKAFIIVKNASGDRHIRYFFVFIVE